MNKQDRLMIKQLGSMQHPEENLPKYAEFMMRNYMEYALIQLAMNLYTLYERIQEHDGMEPTVSGSLADIRHFVYRYVLDKETGTRAEDRRKLHDLRDRITSHMRVLTAFTDSLQIYEYILNRLEFTVSQEEEAIDIDAYANQVFRFLFQDDDKMVVNSKIQMVVAELPVRITKNRFYDILSESLHIYTGSECRSVDDFAETLRACSGLSKPDGFETMYPALYEALTALEAVDFQSLSEEDWRHHTDGLKQTAKRIDDYVTDFMMLEDVVNALYAVMAAGGYSPTRSKECGYAVKVLECVTEAMERQTPIAETAEDCLFALEGRPEYVTGELMQGEAILYDLWTGQQECLKRLSLTEAFADLNLISKLLSSSMFIDLEAEEPEPDIADSLYINQVRDKLTEEFAALFDRQDRLMNRARMAKVLGQVPVFFNSRQEISDYISYALQNCKNQSELKAVVHIINDIMAE